MARQAANVRSLDALRSFKAALMEFAEQSKLALSGATSDIQRVQWWLDNEQKSHWQRQKRKRQELLTRAKSELYRKQMTPAADGGRPSDVDEKRAVEKAKRALEEAERKIIATQKWSRTLDREYMQYRGQIQPLQRAVDADIPQGLATLEQLMTAIEKYLATQAPNSGGAE